MDDALATIYTAHVTINKLRHDVALADAKFDHAVIFSGALHYQFLDDIAYPFKVNPHFKMWVPVTDNPQLLRRLHARPQAEARLLAPVDYWHKVATTPHRQVGREVRPGDDRQPGRREGAHAQGPRRRFIGEWDERFASWGDFTPNPEPVLNSLHFDRSKKTEYEIECLRQANVRGARGHLAAEKAFREGLSEFEIHFRLSPRRQPDRGGSAVRQHHRAATSTAPTLHYYHHDREQYDKTHLHSFLIDAGAQCQRLRVRHHPHLFARQEDEFQELIEAMDAMQRVAGRPAAGRT